MVKPPVRGCLLTSTTTHFPMGHPHPRNLSRGHSWKSIYRISPRNGASNRVSLFFAFASLDEPLLDADRVNRKDLCPSAEMLDAGVTSSASTSCPTLGMARNIVYYCDQLLGTPSAARIEPIWSGSKALSHSRSQDQNVDLEGQQSYFSDSDPEALTRGSSRGILPRQVPTYYRGCHDG